MRYILILLALSACAQTSQVIIGDQRPAIPVEEVKIYVDAPNSFDKIAILVSSPLQLVQFER
jgi:hypothetical protein